MTIRNIDKIVKMGSHPLEQHFNVPTNSTEIVSTKRNDTPQTYETYDSKDTEIEQDYQNVMNTALELVDTLKEKIDSGTEAKFLARLAEVAGQHLSIALTAAEKKSKLKDNKDKFEHKKLTSKNGAPKVVNNTIIMNRNELLEATKNGSTPIDALFEDVTDKKE